jgi:hypothetical protein
MKKLLFLITIVAVFALSYFETYATVPSVQAKQLAFANVTSNSATVYWTRGNGTNRVVVIRTTDNNWAATDAILTDDGPTYTDANGNLLSAPQVGATGSYVIDVMGPAGTPNYLRSTTLSNLAAGTTYYIKVYEFNVDGSFWDYNNSSADNNPRSFKTTSSYSGGLPSSPSLSPWSEGGRLYWISDGASAAGYLLSVWNNSTSSWVFQNRDIGKPTGKEYFIFGLTNNTSYTFHLYPYDATGNVSSSSVSTTQTTLLNPGISSAAYNPGHGSAPYYNNVGIGCPIVVTVTATNGQLGLLPNGTQTINSVNVTSTFADNRNGTYTLTYTVASGHTDINDNGANLPLNFDFKDGNNVPFLSAYTGSGNNLSAPGVDQTRPYVASIIRQSPSSQCTNGNSVTFRVTFNEAVNTSSVTTTDFTITGVSGSGSVGTITSVTPVSPNAGGSIDYDVVVDVTGINREIQLDFTGSVNDMAYGCPNASSTTFTGGQTYYVDHTNPSGTITIPPNAACYRSATMPATFSGTANDAWPTSGPCVISLVEVALWKDNDNNGTFSTGDQSWNGSSWVSTLTWNNATGTTSWTWTHGASFTDGKYYVQIRVTDGAGNQFTTTPGNYFIYDNTAPTGGTITNPTSSGCYKNNDVVNIQWNNATDANLNNTVSIEYYDGSTWVTIVSSYPISSSTGSYSWTVPGSVNTNNAQIRITFSDCAGNIYLITSDPFKIDNTAPTNNSNPQVPPGCLIAGNSYNITWTTSNISDANPISISLYYYDGSNYQLIASGLGNTGSYSWSVPSGLYVCGGVANIRLRAYDCAGNYTDHVGPTFTIDNLQITAQPQNSQICSATGSTTFSVTVSSNCPSSPSSYLWQYSPDNSTWSTVTNGTPANASYSGTTSATLTVISNWPGIPTTGTYYYRCVITSTCGAQINSNSAQLNVVPALNITSYPSDPTDGIIGNPLTVSVGFAGGSPATKNWYLYRDDDGSGYNGTLVSSGSGTSPVSITIANPVACGTAGKYYIYIADNCDSLTSGYFAVRALAPEPTQQVTGISGGRTRTTISLIWTNGDGMGRLVAATYNSTTYTGYSTDAQLDGNVFTGANSYWPSAPSFGTNTRLLYNGTGSSVYVTGLQPSTWYAFRAFEYNYNTGCASTSYNYNTSTASYNPRAIKTTARDVEDEEVVRTSNFAVTPVWPNPVEDVLQFDLIPMQQANFRIEIVAMDGRTLFTHEYSYDNVATTVMIHLDRKLFAPGAYMLRVSALGETLQQPFIFMP